MMLQVINIINKLQQERFTGKLIFKASKSIVWRLYFFSGQIFWMNGGYHPHRFWIRNISYYFPYIDIEQIRSQVNEEFECLYYQMFDVIRQENLITIAEVKILLENKMSDVFFDLLQQSDIGDLQISQEIKSLTYFYHHGFRPSTMGMNFPPIQTKVLQKYKKFKSKFTNNIALNYASAISLNYAPVILKPRELEIKIGTNLHRNMRFCGNGDLSLRDMGFYLQQDPVDFACCLIPCLNANSIKLVPIADFPINIATTNHRFFFSNFRIRKNKPLICCINTNNLDLFWIQKIVLNADYNFAEIDNSLRAIPQLIQYQPNLILLDENMSFIDGFELSSRIKRISQLQNIPIVMLTNTNKTDDKARAYYAGASGSLGKPITETELLSMIKQSLALRESVAWPDRNYSGELEIKGRSL
ncbi:MAG: response regulator [Cyanobacteria bacterium P01_F01_bin.143]